MWLDNILISYLHSEVIRGLSQTQRKWAMFHTGNITQNWLCKDKHMINMVSTGFGENSLGYGPTLSSPYLCHKILLAMVTKIPKHVKRVTKIYF